MDKLLTKLFVWAKYLIEEEDEYTHGESDITIEYLVKDGKFGQSFLQFNVKFSAAIVHHLLRRQIHTSDKTYMKFNFGGITTQFRKNEFSIITGLKMSPVLVNCPLPPSYSYKRIREEYFNIADIITNGMVKDVYTTTTQWIEDDDMMKLSLLYILKCGLLGKESHSEVNMDHVRMVWGYEAIPKLGKLTAHKSDDVIFPLSFDVVATLEASTVEENILPTTDGVHEEQDHDAGGDAKPPLKRARTTIIHEGGDANHSSESSQKYIIPPSIQDEDVIYHGLIVKDVDTERNENVNKEEDLNKEENTEEDDTHKHAKDGDVHVQERPSNDDQGDGDGDVHMDAEPSNNDQNEDANNDQNEDTNNNQIEEANNDHNEEATQEPKEKPMPESESSIVQCSLTKSADTTHIDSKKEENNELDIGVLGYKRLRKKGEKLKSSYVVNKDLRERLKNTLPADHFNPMKPAPDDVVNAFASYMLKEPPEVISLGYEWGTVYPEAKNVVEVDQKAYGGVRISRSYDAIFLG
ncbi:hypothetical protein FNV43_RR07441 [Rhamnella rubrinervis]|uniref:DUF1985 domain-containing protein n=1 Tax=Rhamnella rubrinervis TaxID=2594499 RepID=A0A8K0HFA5_9ROSA|nr:hypothetical protein FNV43_RR07441 [Rhamnella rubrinervis]